MMQSLARSIHRVSFLKLVQFLCLLLNFTKSFVQPLVGMKVSHEALKITKKKRVANEGGAPRLNKVVSKKP